MNQHGKFGTEKQARQQEKLVHPAGVLYFQANPVHFWNHCFYCGLELCDPPKNRLYKVPKRKYRTVDHVEPKANGNKRAANSVAACGVCNGRKSCLSLEEFRIVTFGAHGGEFFGEEMGRKLNEMFQ